MASTNNDIHNVFIVMNQAAVDLANHTAVASVDTDIDVECNDGEDQAPLKSTDYIVMVEGFGALEAGVTVVNCKYKDGNTLTLRTTNASAGAINPASIAANLLKFAVFRR
jgi:hypothetical protein